MPDAEITAHRPLLRLQTERDANTIRAAGFGGVILEEGAHSVEFARECHAQDLSIWLDISALPAPSDKPRKQTLSFDGLQPCFEVAGNELDTLHPQSAHVAIEHLEAFTELISGVLFQPGWHSGGPPFPPFPWSEQLLPSFQARHRFDLLGRLESLVSSGDDAARIRQMFWNEVHLAREENFLIPLRTWCVQHEISFYCDNFRPEWNALALTKNLRARLNAAKTTLESAPAFPALLSDEDNLTREFHGLLRSGASAFVRRVSSNLNSAPQKLRNEIIARTLSAFARSRNAARAGVLFPARSAQTHYHPDGHRFTRWVGSDLQYVTGLLDDLQFDWLFTTETQIAHAVQHESTLRIGANQQELELIIVPSLTAISWQAWEKLEEFVEGGGKVACLGLLPRWSEHGRDRDLENRIGKTTRIVIEDLYEAYSALEGETEMPPTIGYPIFREYHSGGRLCCYQPRLNVDPEDACLRVRQILHESVAPDFETLAPEIRYTHRVREDGELFFVENEGKQTQRVNASFRPLQPGTLLELNPASGDEKPVYVVMPYSPEEGGGVGLAFDLAPAQSRLFEIKNPEIQNSQPTQQHSFERASFEVEFFDGETATGFMMENGTPQVALRRNGKIAWHAGEEITVPAPILPDADEWSETRFEGGEEYSQSLTIPAGWKECRVFLEIALQNFPVQCTVNESPAELKLSAPFRFDVTPFLAFGASNDFTLKIWSFEAEAPITRLVAYPLVTVKITP